MTHPAHSIKKEKGDLLVSAVPLFVTAKSPRCHEPLTKNEHTAGKD